MKQAKQTVKATEAYLSEALSIIKTARKLLKKGKKSRDKDVEKTLAALQGLTPPDASRLH